MRFLNILSFTSEVGLQADLLNFPMHVIEAISYIIVHLTKIFLSSVEITAVHSTETMPITRH